jgi:hypothetical protein
MFVSLAIAPSLTVLDREQYGSRVGQNKFFWKSFSWDILQVHVRSRVTALVFARGREWSLATGEPDEQVKN